MKPCYFDSLTPYKYIPRGNGRTTQLHGPGARITITISIKLSARNQTLNMNAKLILNNYNKRNFRNFRKNKTATILHPEIVTNLHEQLSHISSV